MTKTLPLPWKMLSPATPRRAVGIRETQPLALSLCRHSAQLTLECIPYQPDDVFTYHLTVVSV